MYMLDNSAQVHSFSLRTYIMENVAQHMSIVIYYVVNRRDAMRFLSLMQFICIKGTWAEGAYVLDAVKRTRKVTVGSNSEEILKLVDGHPRGSSPLPFLHNRPKEEAPSV